MKRYYLNNTAQVNGDHEVHEDGCYWLSLAKDTRYLGNYYSCKSAVEAAKLIYRQSNGCKHCATSCHTS